MPRDDDEVSDISYNGESVVFESNTKSTTSFGKVCDIEGIWKSIFFWVDSGSTSTDNKPKPSITTPYSNQVRAETDEERKKRLENDFQTWLTGKANKEPPTTVPPVTRSVPPITPGILYYNSNLRQHNILTYVFLSIQ